MLTSRSIIYLIYGIFVLFTFFGDRTLKKREHKYRVLGYTLCIVGDLGILGNCLWTYFKYEETNYEIAFQTGIVLGGVLLLVCVFCLLGRYWQNKEQDQKRNEP